MGNIILSRFIFFSDTLNEGKPYISHTPRNHDSLFLVTEGSLLYVRNGDQKVVPTGHIGYISAGSIDWSGTYQCKSVSYIAVNFNYDFQLQSSPLPFQTDSSSGVRFPYSKLFRLGLENYSLKPAGFEAVCAGLAMQIIGHLLHETSLPSHNQRNLDRITPVINYINEHYSETGLEVSHLSSLCNMSEKQFRRIFLSLFGKGPYAFLQEFRIQKAEVLLLNTGKSITEIALQTGFSDVYSFSHCFKKHHQLSPATYRETNKA